MYLIVFDKKNPSLSGWHYKKLNEIGPKRLQRSVYEAEARKEAENFVEKLRDFGVNNVEVFKAEKITKKII